MVSFGIDVGGTTVKMGLFDVNGEILEKWEIPTDRSNQGMNVFKDIADALKAKMAEKKISKEDLKGIGMCVPAAINKDGVLMGKAANIGWPDRVDVDDEIHKYIDKDIVVKVGNDANVAAYGEMWLGGGKGYNSICMVTLGTGVGGGIIIDGQIVVGYSGAGGEIGHIHVQDGETEICGCGCQGCLEQYCSATGIVRLANRRLAEDDKASVLRGTELSAKSIFDAVKAGDEVAQEIASRFGHILGKGLSIIAATVNPEIFVIGGGVSKAGQILLDYVKPEFKKHAIVACKDTEFALATLGNDAGIIGAAGML